MNEMLVAINAVLHYRAHCDKVQIEMYAFRHPMQ